MNQSRYILIMIIASIFLFGSVQSKRRRTAKQVVHAQILKGKAGKTQEVFTKIYQHNIWGESTSASGPGSTLQHTEYIRKELAKLFVKYSIKTITDAPCGDWNWMRMVDLSSYVYNGFDIVQQIILDNTIKYGKPNIKFHHANIITDALPQSDIIFCREVLQHLPNKDILDTIRNFKKSKSRYLLVTNIDGLKGMNQDIPVGSYRSVNLCLEPFNFPKPIEMIYEKHNWENYFSYVGQEYLGLWLLDDMTV